MNWKRLRSIGVNITYTSYMLNMTCSFSLGQLLHLSLFNSFISQTSGEKSLQWINQFFFSQGVHYFFSTEDSQLFCPVSIKTTQATGFPPSPLGYNSTAAWICEKIFLMLKVNYALVSILFYYPRCTLNNSSSFPLRCSPFHSSVLSCRSRS